ncbi:hypothetical protein ASE12_02730 [Aeromicrobium sp. Root236]|uniref:hypothetical protein n=1 Tax=Aeromicrobium sp. Root236 TaxID=1736498 RepID=UPI0006FD330E|nr:hypothetical protein [Aeromicrobium sp. Root236]KRC63775.1 hypothetical protein ASE12_02730 [Aeromicrobium sp. Root236]
MSSSSPRGRAILASAPVVVATVAALLAAPSPEARVDPGADLRTVSAPTSGGTATLADAVSLVVAPESGGASATEPTDTAADPKGRGNLVISGVVMVANTDGSATLSATFVGGREPMALKAVSLSTESGDLAVASTAMWLPIVPGKESRAGDASDAGGFVVPRGLAPDQVVRVQLQFDNGTCAVLDAPTVRRTRAHDEVFPTNGQRLGPGKPTAFKPSCPKA